MKVLFITNKFPPLVCGVGDYTYYLAKEFVKNGHCVEVICCSDPQIVDYWGKGKEGISVFPIAGTWTLKDMDRVFFSVKDRCPDRVLFQYVPGSFDRIAVPFLLLYFFFRLSRLPIKIITTFHETYVRYNWSHPKYLYTAVGQRLIAWWIAIFSDCLITSIDRYKRQLEGWNVHVHQIPIGSNIPPFEVTEEEHLKLRKCIAPNGEWILCTFGIRDHLKLLELFAKLYEQEPNVVLLIVGNLRADLNYLSEKLQQHVFITGFLDTDKVFRHLKVSDAFVMLDYVSEKGEGGSCNKSTSLAAAFAAGLPIFATKGDMTNQLLLEKSGIIWIDYHVNSSEKILDYIKKDNLSIDNRSHLFYLEELCWDVIYNRIKNYSFSNVNILK